MFFFYVKVINQVSPDICQIEKMSGKARVPHAGNRHCFEQFCRPRYPVGRSDTTQYLVILALPPHFDWQQSTVTSSLLWQSFGAACVAHLEYWVSHGFPHFTAGDSCKARCSCTFHLQIIERCKRIYL